MRAVTQAEMQPRIRPESSPIIKPLPRRSKWLPPVRQSLPWKLGIGYFLLVFVNTMLACVLLILGFRESALTSEQYTHWDIAQTMVPEVEQRLRNENPIDAVSKYFYGVEQLNPTIDPFLLSSDGYIEASLHQKDVATRIDLVPVHEFLSHHGFPTVAVRGQDPLGIEGGKQTPFSAAVVRVNGVQKYLYVVTSSRRSKTAFQTLGDLNALRAAAFLYFSMIPISALLGWLLFRYFSRNMKSMGNAVAKFGDGDYSARIEVNSVDEIGQLATTINSMAAKLETAIAALDRADRSRRELLANLSHDMRHPITTMRVALEGLAAEQNQTNPVERERLVSKTVRACETLASFVGSLFELARLTDPAFTATLAPTPVLDVVDSVAMSHFAAAAKKSIELTVDAADDLPPIIGDVRLLERALTNLIVNALTHTPEGGKVVVGAAVVDDLMELSVRDTGPGIPAGDLPNLFERFFRSQATTKASGTGLGLAVVKAVAELHGARPIVESTVGVGSVFKLHVPLATQ